MKNLDANLKYSNGIHQAEKNYSMPFLSPSGQNGIIIPGMPTLPNGVERYVVKPAGSSMIKVFRDDKITIIDKDGLQPGEVILIDDKGLSITQSLIGEHKKLSDSIGLKMILDNKLSSYAQNDSANPDISSMRLLKYLKQKDVNFGKLKAFTIFDHKSKANAQERFSVSQDGHLIVVSKATSMNVDEQNPASELIVFIERVNKTIKIPTQVADPLADPLLDENIQPGQAKAYIVKKGQYIQILDVQGRECSDFQAFDLRQLDKNIYEDIDPTTTRSLMGSLYPNPGIFNKYYSINQKPLVEIVQDTVGRHDTFGLACFAKYYEELGYPGHINCSDNLNIAAKDFNIPEKAGWPAVNFFFNTMNDDLNTISMDDPYSRPGDYVLLRALTDLVCFSTACPCDIDEANGWQPTDIQIRVYSEHELFKKSMGFRMTADADLQMTKETAFHNNFSEHTKNFIEYNGYWLPDNFPKFGAIDEYWNCRKNVAIMDLSPLRKYEVTGPDAAKLMQLCVPRDMDKLAIGQVVYTAMCNNHGGMIDDGTIFRLGENNFRWVGGCGTSGLWLREQAQKRGLNAWVKSSTDELHNIAVQGPNSRDLLKEVVWTKDNQPSVEELGWFRFSVARINDHLGAPIVISRTGYTGELGYEIFTHPKHADEVFKAVWDKGQQYGIKPLGLEALNMLRIESGLIFAGYEFDDQTDPFEAGIGFSVPLKTKTADFIGKDALIKRKANAQKTLVGLELVSDKVVQTGDEVYIGRTKIGEITSAMRSPILQKNIALCRLFVEYSDVGTEVEVGQLDGMQKRLSAKVVNFPFYDPKKERVRA